MTDRSDGGESVSKKDVARTDPANQPGPEPIESQDPAAADAVQGGVEPADQRDDSGVGQAEAGAGQIERLHEELAQAQDRALRTQAELENYRKRVARQMEEERRYANIPLIRDLLPVWDSVGRAIEAAENAPETASLLEGFKMVAGQLESVLQQHHCQTIDALGEPFDPNLHQAIYQQPSAEHPAGTVLEVTQTGFRLHDRVVRPSQVIVSAAVPPQDDGEPRDDQSPGATEAGKESQDAEAEGE